MGADRTRQTPAAQEIPSLAKLTFPDGAGKLGRGILARMPGTEDLVATYLRALGDSDLDLMLSLFTPDAVVNSPLYGPLPAVQFFPGLFADTSRATLTLRATMTGTDIDGGSVVSFWFHFDWRLPSGAAAPFEVCDVVRLADDGRIRELNIIYDTVDVRPAFEADVGRPSWRQEPATPIVTDDSSYVTAPTTRR